MDEKAQLVEYLLSYEQRRLECDLTVRARERSSACVRLNECVHAI